MIMYSCPFNIVEGKKRALWEVTYRCNLSCKHCFVFDNQAVSIGKEMNLNECDEMIKLILELGIDEVWLSGGEPLVNKNIFHIIEKLSPYVRVSISSNAALINKEIIDKIKPYVKYVHVSLDGKDAVTHDYVRGVQGTFKKLGDAVDMLREAGITVGASCVVSKHNTGQYKELVTFAINKGISVISFYPSIDLGRGKQETIDRATMQQILTSLKEVEKEFGRYIKIELFRFYNEAPLADCFAEKFLTITPNGLIGPCPWLCKSRSDLLIDPKQTHTENILSKIKEGVENSKISKENKLKWCNDCVQNVSCKKGCLALSRPYDTLCVKNYD